MSEWALILFFFGFYKGGATTVDGFHSQEDCTRAKDKIIAEVKVYNDSGFSTELGVVGFCVEKA